MRRVLRRKANTSYRHVGIHSLYDCPHISGILPRLYRTKRNSLLDHRRLEIRSGGFGGRVRDRTPDKILVLGIGNLVLNDEGIGIHVVNALSEMEIPQGVDVLDGGTGGLALLETLQSYRQLILVDAALDNNPVGTIRRLSPQYSKDYPPLLSAHEIGLKEMIDAMLLLGQAPRIELLAISVRNCHHLGMQLSPEARKAIPQVLQLIFEIINDLQHDRCLMGAE